MSRQASAEWLRAKWENYAPRYDRDMARFERMMFDGGRQWVCAQAAGEVLEVGVGTGRNLPFYSEEVRLTGIDLSPAMLRVAARRASELGRQVSLLEGDAQSLSFPDGSFDTVVATLALCTIPDERAAVAEMARVLRPGGSLLLLDHVGSHHRLVRLGQRLVELLTVRLLGDHQTRRPLPLVERAGLVVRRSERLKAGMVERLVAVKPS